MKNVDGYNRVFFKRSQHFGGIKEERNTFRSGPAVLGAFPQIRKTTISFVISVGPSFLLSGGPHGTTRLLLDGF